MNVAVKVGLAVVAVFLVAKLYTHGIGDPQQRLHKAIDRANAQLPREMSPGLTMTNLEQDGDTVRIHVQIAPDLRFEPGNQNVTRLRAGLAGPLCPHRSELDEVHARLQYRFHYTREGRPDQWDLDVFLAQECT